MLWNMLRDFDILLTRLHFAAAYLVECVVEYIVEYVVDIWPG
jgi:hypothetical protein